MVVKITIIQRNRDVSCTNQKCGNYSSLLQLKGVRFTISENFENTLQNNVDDRVGDHFYCNDCFNDLEKRISGFGICLRRI